MIEQVRTEPRESTFIWMIPMLEGFKLLMIRTEVVYVDK